ncbi:MAG: DUF2283 domain-containing protein [bacterium]|nr:DUF2283 domain-containing protein [bacterium]
MAKATLSQKVIKEIFEATPHLIKFPVPKLWVDYDKEADVLYISFERPQNATDSKMLDNGILLRYKNRKIVGVTVLDASTR